MCIPPLLGGNGLPEESNDDEKRLILNQGDEPYGSMDYGRFTVGFSGCGAVAVYNACLLAGNKVEFEAVVDYMNNNDGLCLGGFFGTKEDAVEACLEANGCRVSRIDNYLDIEFGCLADASIIQYMYFSDSLPFVGIHYVAFKDEKQQGTYYNVYRNSKSPYHYNGTCYQFLEENEYIILNYYMIWY